LRRREIWSIKLNILDIKDRWLKGKLGEAILNVLAEYLGRKPDVLLGEIFILVVRCLDLRLLLHGLANVPSQFLKLVLDSDVDSLERLLDYKLKDLRNKFSNYMGNVALAQEPVQEDNEVCLRHLEGILLRRDRFWYIYSIRKIIRLLCPLHSVCKNVVDCPIARATKVKDERVLELWEEAYAIARAYDVVSWIKRNTKDFERVRPILKVLLEKGVPLEDLYRAFGLESFHTHVDYVALDREGNVWALELKTITGKHMIIALSKKEREAMYQIRRLGFRYGVVLIQLQEAWNVNLKLIEIN